MERSEFHKAIKLISPAFAARDYVPVFTCACFKDNSIYAFDDLIAMKMTPSFKSEFQGGVKGVTLLNWLNSCNGKEVSIDNKEKEVLLKCGKSKLTLPLISKDEFVFDEPKKPIGKLIFKDSQDERLFLESFMKASSSIGFDPSDQSMFGISIFFDKGEISFYSTDVIMISKTSMPFDVPKELIGKSFIMIPRFCEAFISKTKGDECKELLIGKDWIGSVHVSGMTIFSKTIGETDRKKFDVAIKGFTSKVKRMEKLPKGFIRAIQRLSNTIGADDKDISFKGKDGKLYLEGKMDNIIMKEVLKSKINSSGSFFLKDIKKIINHAIMMGVVEGRALIFEGNHCQFIISLIIED